MYKVLNSVWNFVSNCHLQMSDKTDHLGFKLLKIFWNFRYWRTCKPKTSPNPITGLTLKLVIKKTFPAFQDSCFPGCQPWGTHSCSKELDTLSRGIYPVGPTSAWPTYLLILACAKGWESLSPFELNMNKSNSTSQAWHYFEWNHDISQTMKWIGFTWSSVQPIYISSTWTWPFYLGTYPVLWSKKGFNKGEVNLADPSKKKSWYLLALDCAFRDFKLSKILKI